MLRDALERAVLHSEPAVGRQGRGVIATGDQVLVNEHLVGPPSATVLRVSDYPYIVPLMELGMWRPTYVFAAVDHAGADITLRQGHVVRSETVDGGGYPVNKPATAGWNGYGDFLGRCFRCHDCDGRRAVDAIPGPECAQFVTQLRGRPDP